MASLISPTPSKEVGLPCHLLYSQLLLPLLILLAVPLKRDTGGISGGCWAPRRVEQVWEGVGGALGKGTGLGMELTEPVSSGF